MAQLKRHALRLGLALGLTLALVLVVLSVAMIWLNSDAGRSRWESVANGVLATSGVTLRLEGAGGVLPYRLTADAITLSDDEGPWFSATDLEFSWNPWRLLRGQIRIDAVNASAIQVERAPALPPQESKSGQREPLALLDVLLRTRIASIAVARFTLGADLLGEDAAWRIDGEVGAPAQLGSVHRLDIARIDGRPDSLKLRVTQAHDRQSLDLLFELREAAGGLLLSHVAPGGEDSLTLTLNGSGPYDDWHGRVDGNLGAASIDLALGITDIGRQVRLSGRVDPQGFLPEPLATIGAGGFELDGAGGYDADADTLSVRELHIEGQSARLNGQGTFERGDESLTAVLALDETVPGGLSPLLGGGELSGISATLEIDGPLRTPEFRMTGRADAIAVPDFEAGALRWQGTIALLPERSPAGLTFDARLWADRLAWSLPGSGALVRGPAEAGLRGTLGARQSPVPGTAPTGVGGVADQGLAGLGNPLMLEEIDLRLPDARLTGRADFDLATGAATAPLRLTVSDLDSLSGLTGLDLSGAAEFELLGTIGKGGSPFGLDFDGHTRDLGLALPVAGALVSPATAISGQLLAGGTNGLMVRQLKLTGERASAIAEVAIPGDFETLAIDATLEVPEAAVLAAELGLALSGPGTAAGQLRGPFDDPGIEGTATIAALSAGPVSWQDLEARYDLRQLASGVTGQVRVDAGSKTGRTGIETRLALTDDRMALSDLRATAPGLVVTGDVTLDTLEGSLRGDLAASATDLKPLFREFGLRGGGRGNGTLRLMPSNGGQTADLSLSAEGLRIRAGDARPLRARQFELEGRLDTGAARPLLDLNAKATRVTGPSSDFERVELTAAGDDATLRIGIDADGRILDAPGSLTATLLAQLDGEHPQLTLDALTGTLAGHPLTSESRASLALPPGGFELTGLDLGVGGGALRSDVRLGLPSPRVDVTATAIPLSVISLVDPRVDLTGALNGELSLSGEDGGTTGRFEIALDPLRLAGRRRDTPMALQTSGSLENGRLRFEASATATDGAPATLSGDLPLAVDLRAATATLVEAGPLAGRLDWQGDAFDLLLLLPMNDHIVRGPSRIALTLGGTVGRPRIEGDIELRQGLYEHLVTGTVLSPLDLLIVGDGDGLRVDRLEARAGNGGRVTGEGRIGLDAGAGFPAAIKLTFDNAVLIGRDELMARGSGGIALDNALLAPVITGRIEVHEVEARLQNNLPPDVIELDLIEAGDRQRRRNGGVADEEADGNGAVVLDPGRIEVRIDMPQRVFVRGLGLDSEWQGRLDVGGSPARPTVEGELRSIRGIMLFLGRRFRLAESTIRFPGGGEIEPELDVHAVYTGPEYVVTTSITGPISDSEITLSSDPSLPQSEILSQALFGKSSGQLSAIEAVQLAGAVGQMTGRGGGPEEIMGRLRQAVGIDVLRVGSTETEAGEQATSVEAGVYVVEGLYVGAETSTAEESSAVSVEYEVTRKIRIKTDLEQTGGTNIGVEYKHDY